MFYQRAGSIAESALFSTVFYQRAIAEPAIYSVRFYQRASSIVEPAIFSVRFYQRAGSIAEPVFKRSLFWRTLVFLLAVWTPCHFPGCTWVMETDGRGGLSAFIWTPTAGVPPRTTTPVTMATAGSPQTSFNQHVTQHGGPIRQVSVGIKMDPRPAVTVTT